jgi:hypothetical protein
MVEPLTATSEPDRCRSRHVDSAWSSESRQPNPPRSAPDPSFCVLRLRSTAIGGHVMFVTDGKVYEFPDHAAMVIDGSDYVFVVGDEEISRPACDDVHDVEDSLD